jgi:tetratricopeptide (TPR) repeat protein
MLKFSKASNPMTLKKALSLTVLLCTPVLLSPGEPQLLAQPAPGPAAPPAPAAPAAAPVPPQPHPEVQALIVKSRAALTARQFDEALRLFEQALVRARALKDRVGEGTAVNGIGAAYSNLGQPQKALEFYNQALPLRRETGDKRAKPIRSTTSALSMTSLASRRKHWSSITKP